MKKIKEDWDPSLDDMSFEDEIDTYEAEQMPADESDNLYQYDAVGPEMAAPELYDDEGLTSEDYESMPVDEDPYLDDEGYPHFSTQEEEDDYNRESDYMVSEEPDLSKPSGWKRDELGIDDDIDPLVEEYISFRQDHLYEGYNDDASNIAMKIADIVMEDQDDIDDDEYGNMYDEVFDLVEATLNDEEIDLTVLDKWEISSRKIDRILDILGNSTLREEKLDNRLGESLKGPSILAMLGAGNGTGTINNEKSFYTTRLGFDAREADRFIDNMAKNPGHTVLDTTKTIWDHKGWKKLFMKAGTTFSDLKKYVSRRFHEVDPSIFPEFNEEDDDKQSLLPFNESTLREGGPRVNIDYEGIAHQFLLIKDPIKRQEACDKLFSMIAEKNAEAAAKEAAKAQKAANKATELAQTAQQPLTSQF